MLSLETKTDKGKMDRDRTNTNRDRDRSCKSVREDCRLVNLQLVLSPQAFTLKFTVRESEAGRRLGIASRY